ncbi:unnamed protein product [Auanema sp. JU1783]|nr:unnamed protein product [Auanema sp. JU1783]
MSFAGFLDIARKDVELLESCPKKLLTSLHSDFIYKFESNKESPEYVMAEPLRTSGIYWCCSAMDVMGQLDRMSADDIVQYVRSCQCEDGGFAPAPGHKSHLLHTLAAVQTLIIFDKLDLLDFDKVESFVLNLENEDGSFCGDTSSEIDTRFSFVAVATLHLLNRLQNYNFKKSLKYVLSCYNFDGGFGTRPGSESHSGQVYCCLGFLSVTNNLDAIDVNRTAEWLAHRQCASGGLNGRPEKLPDVCYSWWVLASLAMLRKLHWVDKEMMIKFIYACQDDETGGFADRPGDCADPFHTHFGLAALSLLGENEELKPVDAVFCMTKSCLKEKSLI